MSFRAQTILSWALALVVFAAALAIIFSTKIEMRASSFTKEELAPLFEKMPPVEGHCPRNLKGRPGEVEI